MVANTICWLIMTAVLIGGMPIAQSPIAEVTQNEVQVMPESSTKKINLDKLREESIKSEKIFDDYLLPYTLSSAAIEYFGGVEEATTFYNHMADLLEASKGNKGMEVPNNATMRLSNFDTLTDTVVDRHKVASLVISERKQTGTYEIPIAPLQKLHEIILSKYPITDNAGEQLTRLFGDMKVLAPEVLDVLEIYAMMGHPPNPNSASDADFHYWGLVGAYGRCMLIDEASYCDHYLERANEFDPKEWESTRVSFGKSP